MGEVTRAVILEWPVVALVLVAAVLHATWNAITKASGDPLLGLALVTGTAGCIALCAVPFTPFPARAAWSCLAGSIVLHFVYQLFLASAYRVGDLSQVYPIARGTAPAVVALLAALLADEIPTARQSAGLLLTAAAIASLAATGAAARSGRALALAGVTGLLIGAYTVVDGLGVRLAGAPERFIVWSFALDAAPLTLLALWRRRGQVGPYVRAHGLRGAGGGVMAVVAYALVMWALARGAMASVAAIRETSVVLAALIGTRRLGEPFGAQRVLASVAVAVGIALVR